MKYVILLLIFSSVGCFLDPAPNALDLKLPEPSEVGEPDFSIELKDDLFLYKNEKIDRSEIETLIRKFKKEIKEKRKVVMEIKPAKSTKMENVVFLMDLGQRKELDVVLNSKE